LSERSERNPKTNKSPFPLKGRGWGWVDKKDKILLFLELPKY